MAGNPEEIKILLAEDTGTMRKLEIRSLGKLGYINVVETTDGDEAIAKLKEEGDINLIISDWNMPNRGGLELLQWVRSEEKYMDIPFIMATGQSDKQQKKTAEDAGVNGFIAKPFDDEELKTCIETALGIIEEKDENVGPEMVPRKTKSGKVILRIAHIQITDHLVLGVLKHMIDSGTVTPKYFELETQCLQGWNMVQDSLETARVDAACVLAPIAMDLFNFKIPVKLVLLAHKSGSIFVRSRHGIYCDPYEEFYKGRKFHVPHKMSVHHMLAHMFLSRIGCSPSMDKGEEYNIEFEITPPIKMPEFLKKNPPHSGFMVAEPIGTKAIAAGIAHLQFLSHELWENHPCCVVAMREDFIDPYPDAVYEFTELLVQAGNYIVKEPEAAAEIAVAFLDPKKILGLNVPILKNVLTEPLGIKTGNLYPVIEDLDIMQRYMVDKMGVGAIIDLEKFVDLRFAEKACANSISPLGTSKLKDTPETAFEILSRGEATAGKAAKGNLDIEGKYLTFAIENQEFGIDILKIKEIIGMIPIRTMPQAPPHVKGVINLRGSVIPVMDLRLRFGMDELDYTDRTCIIILDMVINNSVSNMGIIVDSVSEVLPIKASEVEESPSFGANVDTAFILAMAKIKGGVKTLLDIDNVLN